jgi:hypothetical protein
VSVVDEIHCSHCGAPVKFNPGEIVATCTYCGFTQVIETGEAFVFEHSMILNKFDLTSVETPIREWMKAGFLKPRDLAKSKLSEQNLTYLPFWIVPTKATTTYKGVFERITPAVEKDGKIEKEYNWLVLARKATEFPTKEYQVPLEGKIPFDFRRVESFARVLNSELQQPEAAEKAKQEIESLHEFLIKEDVDRIISVKTDFTVGNMVYLHAPVWFITYEYKHEGYSLFLDGATGAVIKGDIPSMNVGLF